MQFTTKRKLAPFSAAVLLASSVGLAAVSTSPALAQLTSGQTTSGQTTPPTPGVPGANHHRERHPEIRAALRHLQMAQMNLQKAAHDYAGNREKALDLTQQAIAACQAALQSDTH